MIVKIDTVVFSVYTHPVHATLCVGGNSECVCECMHVWLCVLVCVVKFDTMVFSVHTHPVHVTLCVGGNSECVCECMCV